MWVTLIRVCVAVMTHHNKKNYVNKNVLILLILPHNCSSDKEVNTRNQEGKNLRAGADREGITCTAYWLSSCDLVNMISYRTQYH